MPNNQPARNGDFWNSVNGNFIDISVLEWCKLFGDKNGKHHWKSVINKHQDFIIGLLALTCIGKHQFIGYIKEINAYRNYFIAHLDEYTGYTVPCLDIMLTSTMYLHDYIFFNEQLELEFDYIPYKRGEDFYKKHLTAGRKEYSK